MQDVLMDILRVLSSPNMDIRKKTLDLAMELLTQRNIDEVCVFCVFRQGIQGHRCG